MTQKKKLVFSTGAGISAESGISTFRDSDGLWENYDVMEVASHEGFIKNPSLIHRFYNSRRRDLLKAEPNSAHLAIKSLEDEYDVSVITQNVDDLHERAGSQHIVHLHGELMKIRAVEDPNYIESVTAETMETTPETRGKNGMLMRPHIVFFQEAVPKIEDAVLLAQEADIFVVVGTSLVVYPAAGLISYVRPNVPIYYIDPHPANIDGIPNVTVIAEPATKGMETLKRLLSKK